MTNEMEKDDLLEYIEDIVRRFRASLPEKVEATMFSLNSKIPYKLVGARELLFFRTTDIAEAGWQLFKEEKVIPSFVLMRACVETCCLAYYLNKKAIKFLKDKNEDAFNEVLGRVLGGTRANGFALRR